MLEARHAVIGQYIAVACRDNFLALFIFSIHSMFPFLYGHWHHTEFAYSKQSWPYSTGYKNSSGDEIANVNFLRRYGSYVLQNTKKENLLRLTN